MDMDSFQKKALESVAITQKGIPALAHRTLGLTGEAGILANLLKKVIRDKDGLLSANDISESAEKLGDVLYYVAVLADYFDLSLSDIAKQNINKSVEFKSRKQNKNTV